MIPRRPVDVLHRTARHPSILLDFKQRFSERLPGGTTGNLAFVRELATTAFESGDIQQLTLTSSGDCEEFWRVLESSCQILDPRAFSFDSE